MVGITRPKPESHEQGKGPVRPTSGRGLEGGHSGHGERLGERLCPPALSPKYLETKSILTHQDLRRLRSEHGHLSTRKDSMTLGAPLPHLNSPFLTGRRET